MKKGVEYFVQSLYYYSRSVNGLNYEDVIVIGLEIYVRGLTMARRRWPRKPVAKTLIAGAIIALGAVAAYAAANYFGIKKSAENVFKPATISLAVMEENGETKNSSEEATYENTYEWTEEKSSEDNTKSVFTAAKAVSILNVDKANENNADAYVRVCILPKWVTKITYTDTDSGTKKVLESEVGNHPGLASFGALNSITITNDSYKMGDVTFFLYTTKDNKWSDTWIYNPVDGWFYYKKKLSPGESTSQLLAGVSIGEETKALLDKNGISLSVEILTDSIQTEANAVGARWGDSKMIIGEDGELETQTVTTKETETEETTTEVTVKTTDENDEKNGEGSDEGGS